jgi:hypothetical protein
MTPQRFRQIRNVFDALMEREQATRTVFLEEACQGDKELRSEVQRLIAAHVQAPGWLDKLVGEGLRETQEQSPDEDGTDAPASRRLEGRRMGPYEILRELGADGVGKVYLARRRASRLVLPRRRQLCHGGLDHHHHQRLPLPRIRGK